MELPQSPFQIEDIDQFLNQLDKQVFTIDDVLPQQVLVDNFRFIPTIGYVLWINSDGGFSIGQNDNVPLDKTYKGLLYSHQKLQDLMIKLRQIGMEHKRKSEYQQLIIKDLEERLKELTDLERKEGIGQGAPKKIKN